MGATSAVTHGADDLSALAGAGRMLLAAVPADVRGLLEELCTDLPPALADHFYAGMLADLRASRFLNPEQVSERLKPSMQRWIRTLLTAAPDDVDDLLDMQRVIGDVHARVGIPVDLVSRGARMLKSALYAEIERRATSPAHALATVRTAGGLIDLALEAMAHAYASARDRAGQADTSYRLFSLVQNIGTERERQRALLLGWENDLLYALASRSPADPAECGLARSEFGLWFLHKGLPSFGDTPETREVTALIAHIDADLRERLPVAGDAAQRLGMLQDIRDRLAEIRTLVSILFEGLGDLEAGRDALTSLLNRRFLPTVLRREIRLHAETGAAFAVLLIDLDHFKAINDRHGHDAGDRALQHVATLLGQHTRGSDYLFRFGGEEFLVVLGSVTESHAKVIAQGLCARIASTPLLLPDGTSLPVTASIGLAVQDGHPDYERVLARADAAMYAAKRGGRNRVVVATDGLPEPPGRRLLQPE